MDPVSTANVLLVTHALIVAVTVAGGVAIFTGRFARFHKRDYFAWVFLLCCFGQIASLALTGGCVLTEWERNARLKANPDAAFSKTFLEQYLPFLPEWFPQWVPLITVAAVLGAAVQIYLARRRRKAGSPDTSA